MIEKSSEKVASFFICRLELVQVEEEDADWRLWQPRWRGRWRGSREKEVRVRVRVRGSLLVNLAAKRAKGVETFFRCTCYFSNDPF